MSNVPTVLARRRRERAKRKEKKSNRVVSYMETFETPIINAV
jgi:hypothetical protein